MAEQESLAFSLREPKGYPSARPNHQLHSTAEAGAFSKDLFIIEFTVCYAVYSVGFCC